MTVIVSGMVGGVPRQGGATWAVLQYVLGLRRLGHDVVFLEQVPATALLPAGAPLGHAENAWYFRNVMVKFGLEHSSALLLEGTHETVGLEYADVRQAAERADVLINVAGMLTDEELVRHIPIRVYLDLDPVFTQLWHDQYHIDMRFAGHTHFVTVGLGIGSSECPVPTCSIEWITTVQPVVLDQWPVADRVTCDALTTIANWRGYGSVERDGVFYGQKAHALREYIHLPRLVDANFVLALAIHPDEVKDLEALAENGWQIVDPAVVAATPDDYRRFIQGSKAEIGIAKSGYALSRSGWFSDRSVCYLASGKPVVAQDTGFSRYLPTGAGLFGFTTAEEAAEAIERMERDYRHHAHAARGLAERCFDSDRVLSSLLQRIGAA